MTTENLRPGTEGDPIAVILEGREQQFQICDDLEQIADQLRGKVDKDASRSVLLRLRRDLPIFHSDEEALFQVLRSRNMNDDTLNKWIELSLLDHQACASCAYELDEPLASLSDGKPISYADAFGYMLRCYFEGTRRHLDWEGATIFGQPLAGLSSSDLEEIANNLAGNHSR